MNRKNEIPKVTVYITAYNYGRYIKQAVDSVLRQKFGNWELLIVNDGSTDNTKEVLAEYERFEQIRIIHQVNKGLAVSNNIALRLANGSYVMRLDADDFLDENALLVLSNILDTNEDVGLVYPDYYLVDEQGEILELVRRKKIGEEVELLDLPAHGACTMIRKDCLLSLGGYDETFRCQDGYDLWIRFLERYKPYNVNVPLFYYRQHPESLTKDDERILNTRKQIKRNFVEQRMNGSIPKVLAVVPAIRHSNVFQEIALKEIAGKPLIWHTLHEASRTDMLDRVVVTTDDEHIIDCVKADFPNLDAVSRPSEISQPHTRIGPALVHLLDHLETTENYRPDAVMLLYINTPLRRKRHIEKAIDTLTIFSLDSVVSVCEELAYCYQHKRNGLVPLQKKRELRLEREALYKENGAIILTRTEYIGPDEILGQRLGHITMLPEESTRIISRFTFWEAEQILTEWRPLKRKSD
jgi:glycosyltransferase involved in cell wall biosynthesis